MRAVRRFTGVTDEPDDVQIIECPDRPERYRGNHHRLDQRKGYSPQFVIPRCPIDIRRLIQIVRNALQCAEGDHHHKRKAKPHIGNDRGGKGLCWTAQPFHGRQSHLSEDLVDTSIFIVEHSPPLNLTAGTLSTSMTAAELNSAIGLKIKGVIDARDFKTMRDNMPKLAFLDISEVTIAAYNGTGGTSNISTTYAANRIPDYAFNVGMSSQQFTLASVKLPATINAVGDFAFYSCEALTEIIIPNSVTYIGQGGFGSCYNLMSVVLPNQLTSFEMLSFTGCGISSITIPNTVKTIAYSAFSSCRNLRSVPIPNSVTLIDNSAFERCNSLIDLIIGNSVTYIGYSAFNGCSSFRECGNP